jgi:hypothetical protein
MHSDWFNGIEILQGRWQHGEKVGYCYPSGPEKTLCNWDIYSMSAGHERVKECKYLLNFYYFIFSKYLGGGGGGRWLLHPLWMS